MYKIVRFYYNGAPRRTIKTGLTLEQAQARCNNPETSSKTATSAAAKRYPGASLVPRVSGLLFVASVVLVPHLAAVLLFPRNRRIATKRVWQTR